MKASWTNRQSLQLRYNPCIVKFPQDHIDVEDDQVRIVCEGYLLNSQALVDASPGQSLREIILSAYQAGGMEDVLNLLRGSFVLAIYDKAAGVAYLANDMLSKKPLFYLWNGDCLLADTSYLSLMADAKAAGLPLTIDQTGLNQMLNRCSFLDDRTYAKEIHFLERLEYLRVDEEGVHVQSYEYRPGQAVPDDEDALIEQIDSLFTRACRMAVAKNQAQGYRPVFTLSAGMDSRCAFLKSTPLCKEAGAPTPLCLSYGAADCMELRIASTLAHRQGCDLMLHEINPTGFISDREQLLDWNEGMMYYAGTTGLSRMLRTLDTSSFGLVITGLGGGEIMGDLSKPSSSEAEEEALYQQLLEPLIPDAAERQAHIHHLRSRYASYNEYVCWQDIRTCHNFAYTTRFAFETFSPFLYEDLFLLLLKTPQEKKAHRRLYARWYLKHIGDPTPTSCFQGPVRVESSASPDRLFKGAMRRARRMLGVQSKWDMNPIALWVQKYPENRDFMERALANDLKTIEKAQPALAEALSQRYAAATADEQLRILTVSGMARRMLG